VLKKTLFQLHWFFGITAGLVLALMLLPFRSYPLAFFLVGLSWACFSAQRALDDRLQPALDGQTRWVGGRGGGRAAPLPGSVRDSRPF